MQKFSALRTLHAWRNKSQQELMGRKLFPEKSCLVRLLLELIFLHQLVWPLSSAEHSLVVLHMTWLALVYMAASSGLYFLHECICMCLHWKRPYQKSESQGQRWWYWSEFISESQSGSPLTLWSLGSPFLWYVGHCSPSCNRLSILGALVIQLPWRKQLEISALMWSWRR